MAKSLLTTVLIGGLAFYALSMASGFAPMVLSGSLVGYLGPSAYFGLASLLAGGLVGVCVGTGYAAFARENIGWFLATLSLVSLAYLAFSGYSRGDWVGPGCRTPLADAAAFVLSLWSGFQPSLALD